MNAWITIAEIVGSLCSFATAIITLIAVIADRKNR
jgi:hypothetical protein